MAKKVMEVTHKEQTLFCIKTDDTVNPYRVYRKTWELRKDRCGCSEHRKQLAKCADMESVLFFAYDYFAHR